MTRRWQAAREGQLCSVAQRNRAKIGICAAGIKVMRQCYAAKCGWRRQRRAASRTMGPPHPSRRALRALLRMRADRSIYQHQHLVVPPARFAHAVQRVVGQNGAGDVGEEVNDWLCE